MTSRLENMIRELLESLKNIPLVKAIALYSCKGSIIVISIWTHIIITRYNAKEKELRIKKENTK